MLADYYLWIKAAHIISVIFWMAGMFYLPRLYVYHREAPVGSELSENYKRMEELLLRRIVNPAMVAAWTFGGLLIYILWDSLSVSSWFHAKFTLVVLMAAYHGVLSRWRKAFLRDERPYSSKFFRLTNEIGPVLTIFIVILVIVRPF